MVSSDFPLLFESDWVNFIFFPRKSSMFVLVTQSCSTLCNSMDCSPPGSSVYGILHARKLEWVGISSCRGSSWPRDWTRVSCITGRFFTVWAQEALTLRLTWSTGPDMIHKSGMMMIYTLGVTNVIMQTHVKNFSFVILRLMWPLHCFLGNVLPSLQHHNPLQKIKVHFTPCYK